jgi:hypothetical protein
LISFDFCSTASCPSTNRWRLAQAETRCSGWPPFALARREVLPSIATMSGAVSRRLSTQAVKHSANSGAGSAFITSVSVSCEAMPRSKGKSRRKKSSFRRPQRATSTKSSAPASVAQSTSSRISGSG